MLRRIKDFLKEVLRSPVEALLKVYLSSLPQAEFAPEKVQRILVFAYHGLGNFLMYTPALQALRQRYPNARIDLQVGNNTGCEEVLAGAQVFDNIYNLPYGSNWRRWIDRALEIRATHYDLTLNEFHSHTWKLALLVASSRAPYRAGHVTSPGWRYQFSRYSFVFNIPVQMRAIEHEVDRYGDLVAAIGAQNLSSGQAQLYIHLQDEDREFAEQFLREARVQSSERLIGIQPGTSANMRWKQWPIERFQSVMKELVRTHSKARIILFGSPSETSMVSKLAAEVNANVVVAAGKTSVKQVAALIEKCALLICNDSGLMHMAVAVNTPVVAIYGPTDISRTAPLGDPHTIVRHALPCSPCYGLEGEERLRACPHHDCLTTIVPQEVLAAVNHALGADGNSTSTRQSVSLRSNV